MGGMAGLMGHGWSVRYQDNGNGTVSVKIVSSLGPIRLREIYRRERDAAVAADNIRGLYLTDDEVRALNRSTPRP